MNALILVHFAAFLSAVSSQECIDIYDRCAQMKRYCYTPPQLAAYMKDYCQGTCPKHCSNGTDSNNGIQCGKANKAQGRIIDGKEAKPGAWPWLVSLNGQGREGHICGGSLIAPKWVLTATHCVPTRSASSVFVILGEHNRYKEEGTEQHIKVKKIFRKDGFDKSTLANDISLLELEKPAKLNSRSQVICLPPKGYRPKMGTKCHLAGWGSVTHQGGPTPLLQQTSMPVVEQANCFNDPNFICTGYGDKNITNGCRGDSGGPLMCRESSGRWVQQGVASFVVEYCKFYTGFTPIGDHRDWIKQITGI